MLLLKTFLKPKHLSRSSTSVLLPYSLCKMRTCARDLPCCEPTRSVGWTEWGHIKLPCQKLHFIFPTNKQEKRRANDWVKLSLTPTQAEKGDRYLVYFVFDRKDHKATTKIQTKVTGTISTQGLQGSVSATIDVLDRQTELLVVQRFTSEEQAMDYRDNLQRIHPELRKIKNFVALTSALRDILIFKDVTKE